MARKRCLFYDIFSYFCLSNNKSKYSFPNFITIKKIKPMKKITFLILVLFMSYFAYADSLNGNWGSCAVLLKVNSAANYYYQINSDAGWTSGSYGSNTDFDGYDFGTPTSLTLKGGAGNAWASSGDYYDASSFVLYYRVYKQGSTPGSWSAINLTNASYYTGTGGTTYVYMYNMTQTTIDVLGLATIPGTNTYTFEVTMKKRQYWDSGVSEWDSMIPGGQSVAYDANNSGYMATFTKVNPTTSVGNTLESSLKLNGNNSTLTARFDGEAKVELYSTSGKLMDSKTISDVYTKSLNSGIYMLRINGVSHKVLVQ